MTIELITPDWPAPSNVHAVSTTRIGGVSTAPYHALNLATHVGDEPDNINQNRQRLIEQLNLPEAPRWLNQTHGCTIADSDQWQLNMDADACISKTPKHVCTIMTADCLPVLICDTNAQFVAAVHAGWRGLAAGIIEKTLRRYHGKSSDLMVWLGPAIGPSQFEVGPEVVEAFCLQNKDAHSAFVQQDSEHYLADIYQLARQRIQAAGVTAIYGGEYCTVSDAHHFFSYRRDGVTGRMASMIWIR